MAAWSGAGGTTLVAEPDADVLTDYAPRYRVLMHNDDVTTMDFVVGLLRAVFGKPHAEARRIMLEVHETGVALVEVVPLEEAETHVVRCKSLARARGFPLALTIELAD